MKKTYQGSCHCGAVRFEAELDLAAPTHRCNCRFCTKARFWFVLVPNAAFRLLAGEDVLADYQHTPAGKPAPFLHFHFCRQCGMRPFSRSGALAAPGEGFHAVNLGCLDDASDEELAVAPITYANGRDNDWQHAPAYCYL